MADPIEHVVIIVKENHTFDNYFGTFPGPMAQRWTAQRIRRRLIPTTSIRRG